MLITLTLSLAASSVGCESSTPEGSSPGDGGGSTATSCAPDPDTIAPRENIGCVPDKGDYTPRDNGSSNDDWPACVSDDNQYHRFSESISSVARVGAFEQIAKLLSFGKAVAPSSEQFVQARVAYTADQGLESRLSRREDMHYPAAPKKCRDLTPQQQMKYANRCVGPAKMRPILNEAFQQGSEGKDPAINAARVEGTLLWFFYVSAYKESTTCADKPKDCDSSWAYYTGGEPRDGGLGLSRYVRLRDPATHDRIWDAFLGIRCWRDLDNPTGVASNDQLHAKALAQLDSALDRGLADIIDQRLETATCPATWAFLQIVGPAIDRAATARDPQAAAKLREVWKTSDPKTSDVKKTQALIDGLFPCP